MVDFRRKEIEVLMPKQIVNRIEELKRLRLWLDEQYGDASGLRECKDVIYLIAERQRQNLKDVLKETLKPYVSNVLGKYECENLAIIMNFVLQELSNNTYNFDPTIKFIG
jgi:hypothetical protein